MKRKVPPAAIITAAAIVGLVGGYRLAQQPESNSPERAIEELENAHRQITRLHHELDQEAEMLLAMRASSDSLLRSRWTHRARNRHTRHSIVQRRESAVNLRLRAVPATERTSGSEANPHATYLLRADDRLIARLVLERQHNDRLHKRYEGLLQAYRQQQELMQEHVSLSRQVARRNRRRAIVTTAAVATAATLLITRR
ncbi:MAG: hypothetical protein KJO98_13370 [Rhodothermia bacterium]|nr:hypothetical protein [Rhodothermia bacterium]